MIHGKKVQLCGAKAFLEEVSGAQDHFEAIGSSNHFCKMLRGYVNSFCVLHWAT